VTRLISIYQLQFGVNNFHNFSLDSTLLHLLIFTVCNQFSRGVYSMLGAVSPDSFDTLHSYSNTFQMPFVTPWFPEKVNVKA